VSGIGRIQTILICGDEVRLLKGLVHREFRLRKIELFFEVLRPSPHSTLLDIGGGQGISGEFARLYGFFDKVVIVNLNPDPGLTNKYSNIEWIVEDACDMKKIEKVDYVFSNAVIEHVGSFQRQEVFAREVLRVAKKGYFITTPNFWFPFEPHYLLPFGQYLPRSFLRQINKRANLGYLRKGEWEEIYLLSRRKLSLLFPTGNVTASGMRHSLVVWERYND
jgi:hypothetical protein